MIAEPLEATVQVELPRHRFTVAEFARMMEMAVLDTEERVELVWGEVVKMSPINIAHTSTLKRLIHLLSTVLAGRMILSVQDPIQLFDDSLPQPDIAVLKVQDDFYSHRNPNPDDVLLLIEVSDTSLPYDRKVKSLLYGSAGIIDYWIVNLVNRQIEVHRDPQPDGYRMTIRYTAGESLSCLAFPDIALKVDDIMAPPSE